jgi:phosphatidylserine decarboxylase
MFLDHTFFWSILSLRQVYIFAIIGNVKMTHLKKITFLAPFSDFFSLFLVPKTRFRIGRHENKEKRLFYFGLRILLLLQIQLLDFENRKCQ